MALFEPFSPLFELQRDRRAASGSALPSFVPPADIVVTDEDVTIVMDVPGMKEDDLAIELREDVLTVRGERPFMSQEDGDGRSVWQRLERGIGKFERVLQIPQGLDPERVNASMENGVLTLHVAKPESRRPRRIEISTNGRTTIEGSATEEDEEAEKDKELAGSAA